MDKGAHYHRCDFQVHTPRDRQWKGAGAVTDDERRAYAREFVAACSEKGIDAVAITDHHDMTFVKYIREAATSVSGTGLVVFPAMELTLGVPCQALLIFDANFPDDLFSLAMTALAIAPASVDEARTAETQRLNHLTSMKKVQEDLDKHTFLRGRYILLPNVSEGGSTTLLRSGHAAHYADMNCVGGYLDGDESQLGVGNRRILDGKDSAYGSRRLGLFQTSDNRRRDFADLGKSTTWVKWAEPTAEALRQACLARESRLSQTNPNLPRIVVTALEVSNSAFMGPVRLEFNPQFNALIGGRGTGKSTSLEYLRWGLCDAISTDNNEATADSARKKGLVDETLKPFGASVDVHLTLNGVPHVVRRHSTDGSISLKIGGAPFEPCSDKDVRSLLPIQAYSQKQLSSVGVRLDELRRFVREPARVELAELTRKIQDASGKIRSNYANVATYRRLLGESVDDDRSLRSLAEQATAIRADLTGLNADDLTILNSKPGRDAEAEKAQALTNASGQLLVTLERARISVQAIRIETSSNAWLNLAASALSEFLANVGTGLNEKVLELDRLQQQKGPIGEPLEAFRTEQSEFLQQHANAKDRSSAQQGKLEQVAQIEEQARLLRERTAFRQTELSTLGNPESDLEKARDEWCQLHEAQSALLTSQCLALTALSDGNIRATLAPESVADAFELRLRSALTGTNIRREKIRGIADHIARAETPVREARKVLDELESLLRSGGRAGPSASGVASAILTELGFSTPELSKISEKLTVDAWVELATTSIEDQPSFSYRLRENEYIPFANASAGQQATALLWALLNQIGPPLIIDQPEDDLDNQILLRVVEQIWRAKESRQLLFSSHNANVVVNGDADLVVCFDYRVVGEQAGGVIRSEGAIDLQGVRQDIASIMEGGKAAFRLRQDKYGF